MSWKLNGSKAIPSPTKCLLMASTQCRRSECSIALVPSMTTRTATVRKNQTVKKTKIARMPVTPVMLKALAKVMVHRTMESCW
jgi:hypothetical protein